MLDEISRGRKYRRGTGVHEGGEDLEVLGGQIDAVFQVRVL